MAIDVTCPGCFKRFQVSDKYAGMKGPCPSCNTIIDIPKASVKVHVPEDFVSGGKTVKGRAILKPIDRKIATIGAKEWGIAVLCVIAAFAIAFVVQKYSKPIGRYGVDAIGSIGTIAVAFGVSIFGYILLRSGDELEYHEGAELYKRGAMCAGAYGVLWLLFEMIVAYLGLQGGWLLWVYFVPFVFVSILLSLAIFDLDTSVAAVHYIMFFFTILFLRWAIGFGWLWIAAQIVSEASGGRIPPPPPVVRL